MFQSLYIGLIPFIIGVVINIRCQENNETMTYLKHFGYMGKNRTEREGIMMFQRQAGIEMTGNLDEETMKMMEMYRCGSDEAEIILRGSFHGSRWRNLSLTYSILDYPSYLEKAKVDQVIANAFNEWAKFVPFQFTKTIDSPIFTITFMYNPTVNNMNGNKFVGTGKYPIFQSHIRFNKEVKWTTDNVNGMGKINLYHVALHEIGHTLGLLHSSYPNSIMTPYIDDSPDAMVQLHPSDKKRIRKLYDFAVPQLLAANGTTTVSHSSYEVPSICNLTKIDAIIAYAESVVYVFNEGKYWLLKAWTDDITFDEMDYPRQIMDYWKDGPYTIDTAFVDIDNATYFLKGYQCWKYLFGQNNVAPGFPKNISEEFPGIPNDIDAAMAPGGGEIYFFKGNEYWKFNRTGVPSDYPKPIRNWGDIPGDLDAALSFHQYNSETYFFKNMDYYKYQEDNVWTIRGFPRPTAFWWFNC